MARRVVVALLGPVAWTPPGIDPVRWRTALAEDVVDLLATLNEVETAVAVTPADRWLADEVVWPGTTVLEVPEPTAGAVFAALRGPAVLGEPAGSAGEATLGPAVLGGSVGPGREATLGGPAVLGGSVGPGREATLGGSVGSGEEFALGGETGPAGYDQAAVVVADAPDVPGLTIGKLLRPLSSRPVAVAPVEGAGPGLLGVAVRLPVPEWLPALDLDTAAPAEVRVAAPRPGDVAVTAGWRRLRGPADLATLDPAVEGWEATRALLSAHPH